MEETTFRWAFVVLLSLNLTISAVFRRRARAASGAVPRSSEGALAWVRLAVVLPLLTVIVGYAVAPSWGGWPRLPLPDWVRIGGVGLGLACAGWLYWVLKTIGRNISETVLTKSEHELVVGGPYRVVRHPLYSGGLLLSAALTIVSANALLALLLGVFLILLTTVIIPKEEANLIAKFGDRYREYRRRVGGLVPRL